MTCGIYKIVNTLNGKFYLGSSKNIEKRFKKHLKDASKQRHNSIHFQRAYGKYGSNVFILEIIKILNFDISEKDLLNEEQFYLDSLTPWNDEIGYNISKYASGGDLISYHPNRDAIVEKIKIGHKNWLDSLSDEERIKRFVKYGENNPNYGNTWTEKQREHLSKLNIGKERSLSSIEKQKSTFHKRYDNNDQYKQMCSNRSKGENNPFFGKTHSSEVREKIRKSRKLNKNKYNNQKISIEIDGIVYSSFSEAAKAIGCAVATIRNRLNRYLRFPNYKLIPKLEQPALVEDCNLPV